MLGENEKKIFERTVIIDLSKVDPSERKNLCKLLGGYYDEEEQTCLAKIEETQIKTNKGVRPAIKIYPPKEE